MLGLLVLAVIAGTMLLYESDLLWKVQEKNLFLSSMLFFKEQMVVPGGLLTWVGMWFTQFLYSPWLGVLMLCCWWLLLMVIIKQAFRIADRWSILLLIPVALLLLTNMDLGYWVYMLKLRGHFFISTIGTTAVAALLWGFRCIPAKWYLRAVYIFATCALGYPLMGIYALATALLMGVWMWRLTSSRAESVLLSVVALLSVIAIPLFCYRYVYYQTNLANIYWAAPSVETKSTNARLDKIESVLVDISKQRIEHSERQSEKSTVKRTIIHEEITNTSEQESTTTVARTP